MQYTDVMPAVDDPRPIACAAPRASSTSTPACDVLLLDSRDSFTFNLAQAWGELGASVVVVDASAVSAESILHARAHDSGPRLVCIGPGPRGPRELPGLVATVAALDGHVPMLGVCLGLQVLVRARGGSVERALAPMHGRRDAIKHDGAGLFDALPSPLWVMRYHSLVATSVPSSFVVTARDARGQVMGVRDAARRIEAVQFHPESIGTAGGLSMLRHALRLGDVSVGTCVDRDGAIPSPSSEGPRFASAVYGR